MTLPTLLNNYYHYSAEGQKDALAYRFACNTCFADAQISAFLLLTSVRQSAIQVMLQNSKIVNPTYEGRYYRLLLIYKQTTTIITLPIVLTNVFSKYIRILTENAYQCRVPYICSLAAEEKFILFDAI